MKPILFNAEMVCAVRSDQKTATRRVIKPQPRPHQNIEKDGDTFRYCGAGECKPPCLPGDVLYVRETWALQMGIYWHTAGLVVDKNGRDAHGTEVPQKWRPSIHMPKEAARIFLRVTDVRAEQLQDISPVGLRMEGIRAPQADEWGCEMSPEVMTRFEFERIWDTTIKKKDIDHFGWEANPWVWVIEFERISREEAMSEK